MSYLFRLPETRVLIVLIGLATTLIACSHSGSQASESSSGAGGAHASIRSPSPTPVPTPAPTPEPDPQAQAIFKTLAPAQVVIGSSALHLGPLRNLYSSRGYKPLWTQPTGVLETVAVLRRSLTVDSINQGLLASSYWTNDIEARLSRADATSLLELDLLLSDAYLSYASDLSTGRTNPEDPAQNLGDIDFKKRPLADFATLAKNALTPATLVSGLAALEPQSPAYAELVTVLTRLNAVKAAGGWPQLQITKTLKPGMTDPAVALIRARLVDLGYAKDAGSGTSYDSTLKTLVAAFQAAMKLPADGVIGPSTATQLAVSLENRIHQLQVNLERWRLLPHALGDRYIFVDLGQQELHVFKNGQETLTMKTVVGQEQRQTPSFVDQVTSVIVNPYWTAPVDIVVKDVLPKAINDPDYFLEMHMRVYSNGQEIDPEDVDWSAYDLDHPPPFSFREDPGDNNSLGRLKFNLSENHHSIYMHDTNHHELFQNSLRLFSSGCIRLEKPLALAIELLGPQGITESDITQMIDRLGYDPSAAAHDVPLRAPVRVYIVGTTVKVDGDGFVRFGPDIYHQDVRLLDALNGVRRAHAEAPHVGSGP